MILVIGVSFGKFNVVFHHNYIIIDIRFANCLNIYLQGKGRSKELKTDDGLLSRFGCLCEANTDGRGRITAGFSKMISGVS